MRSSLSRKPERAAQAKVKKKQMGDIGKKLKLKKREGTKKLAKLTT